MGVWQFIQDQVFGMKWLNELIGKGLSKLGLDVGERIGGSIQFFFYDAVCIKSIFLCREAAHAAKAGEQGHGRCLE